METKHLTASPKLASGPGLFGLIAILLKVRKDPFAGLVFIRKKYGDFIRVRMPYVAHLICHPDHMKHIFKDNAKNYMMRGKEFYEIEPLLGNGVLLSNDELWVRQRRTIGLEFSAEASKSYAPTMIRHVENLTNKWEKELKDDDVVEMTEEMMNLTLQIAADCFFGTSVANAKIIGDAVDINANLAAKRIRAFIKLPRTWPTPAHKRADESIRRVDEIVYKLMNEYRSNPQGKVNVLSRLMAAQQKLGTEMMSDKLVRDEIVTILISGHETTASLLFWTLYCLSENPEIEQKLARSIHEAIGDKTPGLEDLESLSYPRKVLLETLRLYPAFASLSKQVKNDDEINGCFIPGGSLMNVCVWLTHRHPDFWKEPDKFDPSRFEDEEMAKRHPYAFLPFGKGPRACIGEHFAMIEAQLLLIRLIQKFKFTLLEGHHVVPGARITTFPLDGVKMKVRRRSFAV
jgi:cytochrome P450